jgi:DNA-binding MarR family transcriptional regulator
MTKREACDCTHVLLLLLTADLYVNEIISKSRLYKAHVRRDIATLTKAQLITERGDPDHLSKKVKLLTPLGRELAKLKDGVCKFQKAYNSLQRIVKSINDLTRKDPKVIKKLLKDKKWTDEEIENYKDSADNVLSIDGYTLRLFSDALIARYVTIMSGFNPNRHAKSVLVKIVTDALSEHLLSRANLRAQGVAGDQIFEDINPGTFDMMDTFDLTNKFANNEIKDLFKSAFVILGPPKAYLDVDREKVQYPST